MFCLFPITVRKGQPNEAVVPCGKCYNCMAIKRNDWIFRLYSELLDSKFGFFITLTYSDENLPKKEVFIPGEEKSILKPYPDKRDIQLFLKRLRKKYGDGSFRYFAVSEYGETTLRPHWHMLLFCKIDISIDKYFYDSIKSLWKLGNVMFGDIEPASIVYCTKYVLKDSKFPLGIKDTCTLMSRRPALGTVIIMDQLNKFNLFKKDLSTVSIYGTKSRIPRLFLDKLKNNFSSSDLDIIKESRLRSFDIALERSAREHNMSLDEYKDFLLRSYQFKEENIKKHLSNHNKI